MKIHPNAFVLEEFLLSLSVEHLEVVVHLTRCLDCRRRFQSLADNVSSPSAQKLAEVLQWPRGSADYGAGIESDRAGDPR